MGISGIIIQTQEKQGKKMVDNRSAGFYGIGGGFNFKSGDISGTAAKTSDDKADQGTEYFAQNQKKEKEKKKEEFVDRSAQLRASLDSLAIISSADIRLKRTKTRKKLEKKGKRTKKALEYAENDAEVG